MRVLAVIPARAGSKRLQGKNTRLLGGVPLWMHAVEHAKASKVIQRIIVSTDDETILARPPSGYELHHRPDYLATDTAEIYDLVRAIVLPIANEWDALCILQPTSPLRTGADIQSCVRMMDGKDSVESVVSVTEGPDDLAFRRRHANRIERIPSILIPNGAVYLLRTDALVHGKDWYGPFAYAYIMPKERSVDINVQFDMDLAEMYLPQVVA